MYQEGSECLNMDLSFWTDGRSLGVAVIVTIIYLAYLKITDSEKIYNSLNECKSCGEHLADAHQPNCRFSD